MLSRVADSLFWASRYVERAENIAAMVDVNIQLMLDLPTRHADAISRDWSPLVACLGDEVSFASQKRKGSQDAVVDFLVFDRTHPGSIVGSLAIARENARTIREQITTEMWEQINRTYLWLMSKGAHQFYERNHYDFFQRVRKSLQLFQGITDSLMVRGEGWDFIQLGKYLERAEKTSRMLDDKFFLLPLDETAPLGVVPQWVAILRSCSARQAYQRLYAMEVEPIQVADLLLLNDNFPRSLVFCLLQIDHALRRISGVPSGRYSNIAEKLSGRLLSELSFSSVEEFWGIGLHSAVDQLQQKLNDLGSAIASCYLHPVLPPPTAITQSVANVPQ